MFLKNPDSNQIAPYMACLQAKTYPCIFTHFSPKPTLSQNLILISNANIATAFPTLSTAYKIIKKLVPHFGFYPAYLTRSLDHWTGERLLAGSGDDGSERSMVRHRKVPGLLE